MDDARRVRGHQPSAGLAVRIEDLALRSRRVGPARQGLTRDVLHRDKDTILKRADVVYRHDVRMGELGHRLCLAPQARARTRATVAADELESDHAIELGIARR